jgi:hypothetical protein
MNVKRIVASALVKAAADLASGWVPTDHDGIAADVATGLIAKWVAYTPPECTWDDRLGSRADAGGRKATTRKTAEPATA